MNAKKDSRIKVIHKPNGGLSDARNHGIDAATGKYLGFVDGDDYIEPEMYEKLHNALVENDADISICSFRYVGGHEDRNDKIAITDEVLSGKEILLEKRAADNAWGWGYAWNKHYFTDKHLSEYLLKLALYSALTLAACAGCYFICTRIGLDGIPALIVNLIVATVVSNIVFAAGCSFLPEFRPAIRFALNAAVRSGK